MFNLFKGFSGKPPEAKGNVLQQLLALGGGQASWTTRQYAALAREGYGRNPVVYRCVRMIAEACASVPLKTVDETMSGFLHQPNAVQTGVEFREILLSHLLLSGNAYLEALQADGELLELHLLRPDRVRVVTNAQGHVQGWEYGTGRSRTYLAADPDAGRHGVLHLKLFHPQDDHYGMGPLQATACAVDVHNAGANWNKAMLDNAARPSGALVYRNEAQGNLSQEQFERLKEELGNQHQGAANAGRPLLLEGGLDWKPMGYSPVDMDFLQTRHAAAREIALGFGVPPMLLGIPGDATYANYREANRAFWRQTVLPLVRKTSSALSIWLNAWSDSKAVITFRVEDIPALQEDRAALWQRVSDADFLNDAEKRELVGMKGKTDE